MSETGSNMHRVSVIIPAYNAEATLGRCLSSLHRQSRPPDEIIVVDDGSTDGTAKVAQRHGARIISQGNAGPAAARNVGARAASGEVLLFTDADCAPTCDWVECMVLPFSESVSSRLMTFDRVLNRKCGSIWACSNLRLVSAACFSVVKRFMRSSWAMVSAADTFSRMEKK